MAPVLRFIIRRALLSATDRLVTSPLVRWTWTGPANEDLSQALVEFRPTDRESILEMIEGRYLLASKLVDTHGDSPFSVEVDHEDWIEELESFSWLRHFRDARTDEERVFARHLALDWIDREGRFSRRSWAPLLTARRVLNWLRHQHILFDGAPADEQLAISRSLGTQIASLKLRSGLLTDPVDQLLVAIALAGVAICADKGDDEVPSRLRRVQALLGQQLDGDALHKSRSARIQVLLLVELITIALALRRHYEQFAASFAQITERMQKALDAVSLGTGEPGYFNGTGQMPHDIIVAVQAQSAARARSTGISSGYGRLVSGRAIVVADSGIVPPPEFAAESHASALAFEFSHGRDLVVANCGPAPPHFEDPALFRQGIAHSTVTLNAMSAAALPTRGALAGRLVQVGKLPGIQTLEGEDSLVMRAFGYVERFGITIERHLTLLPEGKTLVGQDKFIRTRPRASGAATIRFHLANGTDVEYGEDLVRLRLNSGALWTFLWEGAEMRLEDSVRQSSYFGFQRTKQIVLEAHAAETPEVSWVFSLND